MSLRPVLAALVLGAIASPVLAADLGARKAAPPVPAISTSCKETEKTAVSNDSFGFSSGSDVMDLGTYALGVEYNGAFKGAGFKTGNFSGHLGKVQLLTSFVPCWEFDPYLLTTTSTGSFRGTPGDIKQTTFGAGVENKYKLFGRATHGVGVTIGMDQNYQGFNAKDNTVIPSLGWNGGQVNSSYKLLIDKELVSGKVFGAINVQWDQIWTERPSKINPIVGTSDYVRNSNLTISGALNYQAVDGLFIGGEARYVRTHNGLFFNQFTGDALYVGPTLFWQATKSVALSGTWGVQVAGNTKFPAGAVIPANIRNSDLNLITANQHIGKIKLGYSF